MEGERGFQPNYDQLQISFSAPPPHHPLHHEMGFIQFEDQNQMMSFLVPSQSSQISQPLDGGGLSIKPTTITTSNRGFVGLDNNELLNTRPSWDNDQVVGLVQ